MMRTWPKCEAYGGCDPGEGHRNFRIIEGGVDDVLSHNFFANLYYDYARTRSLRRTWELASGFRGFLWITYKWTRNHDPDRIPTLSTTRRRV